MVSLEPAAARSSPRFSVTSRKGGSLGLSFTDFDLPLTVANPPLTATPLTITVGVEQFSRDDLLTKEWSARTFSHEADRRPSCQSDRLPEGDEEEREMRKS